jgi:hypothetical protein
MREPEEYVIIGGISYKVEHVHALRDGDQILDGHIRYSPSLIQLDAGLGPQAAYVTLWHEILHALLTHAGRDNHDETQISALAYGIAQVLRDNPWLNRPPLLPGGPP